MPHTCVGFESLKICIPIFAGIYTTTKYFKLYKTSSLYIITMYLHKIYIITTRESHLRMQPYIRIVKGRSRFGCTHKTDFVRNMPSLGIDIRFHW